MIVTIPAHQAIDGMRVLWYGQAATVSRPEGDPYIWLRGDNGGGVFGQIGSTFRELNVLVEPVLASSGHR